MDVRVKGLTLNPVMVLAEVTADFASLAGMAFHYKSQDATRKQAQA